MQNSRVIGILGNTLGDPYSLRIMEGAYQRFSRLGFNTVGLAGGFPHSPIFRNGEQLTFPSALDAILLLSETLENGERQLEEAVASSEATAVSIGVDVAKASSVRVNDEIGILQAVAHLVRRHDCKKIAFIAGPEQSADSQRRLAGFRQALEDFGLTFDRSLVARGDFEARSGYEAVRSFRQRGKRSFDAIFAANDLMAIGAMEGLRACNIPVPDTVKVVGFDDTPEAAFVGPSLTTVRQPIFEQGMASADLIAKLLAREPQYDRTMTSTSLVIRQSCGCTPSEGRRLSPSGSSEDQGLIDDAFRRMIRRQLASRRIHGELSRNCASVIAASGYPELAAAVTRVYRLLGLKRFLLCMYTGNKRQARVVLESTGRDIVFRNESEAFPVGKLFPSGFLRGVSGTQFLVEPLHLAEEHLGYTVIEAAELDPHAHLELRHMLSSAVGRIVMARELRRLYVVERKLGEMAKHAGVAQPTDSGQFKIAEPERITE